MSKRQHTSKSTEVIGTIKENRSARSTSTRSEVQESGNGVVRMERSSSSTREIAQSRHLDGIWRATEDDSQGGDLHNAKSPDAKSPDAKNPDTKSPDAKSPDANSPDANSPDAKNSDTKDPDTKDPDTKDPDTKDPDTKDPDTKDPDTKDPDTKEPDTKDPDISEDIFMSDEDDLQPNQELTEIGRGIPSQLISTPPTSTSVSPPRSSPRPSSPGGYDPDMILIYGRRDQFPYLGYAENVLFQTVEIPFGLTGSSHFLASQTWGSRVTNASSYETTYQSVVSGDFIPGVIIASFRLIVTVTLIFCRCNHLCGCIRIQNQLTRQFTHYYRGELPSDPWTQQEGALRSQETPVEEAIDLEHSFDLNHGPAVQSFPDTGYLQCLSSQRSRDWGSTWGRGWERSE